MCGVQKPAATFALILLALGCNSGCRMGAPLVVWNPPLAEPSLDGPLAIAPLAGPPVLASRLEEHLLAATPEHGPRVIRPEALQEVSAVRPASVPLVPSDLSAIHAAREKKAAVLLHGEVLSTPEVAHVKGRQTTILPDGRLAVAWKLVDPATGETQQTLPMSLSTSEAVERYPELAFQTQDEVELLSRAAAREAWRLVQPHVSSKWVQLALPWFTPGADLIRRGNAYARASRWPEAQQCWEEALAQSPSAHAAVHNLALAAAARQDFAEARRLAMEASRLHPCDHYESTYAWVEAQRWAYHQAFNLPDPPEGWPLRPPGPSPR